MTVGVAGAPTLTITPPTSLNAGSPGVFQFVVGAATANGSPVRSVTVNWGDRTPDQNLGAIYGTSSVTHVYA